MDPDFRQDDSVYCLTQSRCPPPTLLRFRYLAQVVSVVAASDCTVAVPGLT